MSLTITWEQVDFARAEDGGDLIDATTTEIQIDLVTEFEFTTGGQQTLRPIENGAPAADHWQRSLDEVTVQCAHTNSPPNTSPEIQVTTVETAGGAKATMGQLIDGGAVSRIQALQDDLRALIHAGHLVTVTGLDRVLTDWRILSMTNPRPMGRKGLMSFSLQIQEVIRATVATTEAPAPRVERARPRRDDGGNNGQEAETPETQDVDNRTGAARVNDAASTLREGLAGWRRRGGS